MDPNHSMMDPFGGSGMPGDPMEQVLSLQAYDTDAEAAICSRTCACNTVGCTTNSCTLSCAARFVGDEEEEVPYAW